MGLEGCSLGWGKPQSPPHNPGCFSQSHSSASWASGLHRGGSHLMPQEDSQSEGGGLRLPAGLCFLQLGDLGKNKLAPGVAGRVPSPASALVLYAGQFLERGHRQIPGLGAGVGGWISDGPPGLFPSASHPVSLHPLDSQGRTSPPSSFPLFSPVPAPAPPPSVPSSLYSCPPICPAQSPLSLRPPPCMSVYVSPFLVSLWLPPLLSSSPLPPVRGCCDLGGGFAAGSPGFWFPGWERQWLRGRGRPGGAAAAAAGSVGATWLGRRGGWEGARGGWSVGGQRPRPLSPRFHGPGASLAGLSPFSGPQA